MEIRRVRADEWAQVRDLRLAALADSPEAFSITLETALTYPDEVWIDRVSSQAHGPTAATFVACDGQGQLQGMVVGIPGHEAGEIELVSMYTAPEARGSGVGAGLVEAVQSWAAASGHASVWLWVMRDNHGAHRLYERCGFVDIPDPVVRDGDPCGDEIRMRWLPPT